MELIFVFIGMSIEFKIWYNVIRNCLEMFLELG